MSSDRVGQLVILSAPSGAGKTTLARRFQAEHPGTVFSVSCTTRAPRGKEQDGVDYHFVSEAEFADRVLRGEFAEWAEVHGKRYGTLKSVVDDALGNGHIVLFDIDVQGGDAIRARWPRESLSVFLLPPSMVELERRLRSRSTDSDEVIDRRLKAARAEIARGGASYDFVIVNDEIAAAAERLAVIAASHRAELLGRPDPALAVRANAYRRGAISIANYLAGA